MLNAKQMAEQASVTAFLNCYLRETGAGVWREAGAGNRRSGTAELKLLLPSQGLTIIAGAAYRSPTGRHQFRLPTYRQDAGSKLPVPIPVTTLFSLLIQELCAEQGEGAEAVELLLRALQSCRLLESFIAVRAGDAQELYNPKLTFLESEQSLVFGHTFHPTPKSRQGFPEWRQGRYSPETKGSFKLHYFAVHVSLLRQGSESKLQASDITRSECLAGMAEAGDRLPADAAAYIRDESFALVPVHPIQAEELMHGERVQSWLRDGKLISLGPIGLPFFPTSSIRTVYHPQSDYMYKFSLPVKITNSMRLNRTHELEGALEAARLAAAIEPWLGGSFPRFRIIRDLAYATIGETANEESGFELIIRENPFKGESSRGVALMASFTQEAIPAAEAAPLLANVIRQLAERERRQAAQISVDWFRAYLAISLRPLAAMYAEHGIVLEAHLQNCLLRLDEAGYPELFYYRDSQGYYYARSRAGQLETLVPGLASGGNVYDDELAEERFGYYLLVNHLFGLIQSFGLFGLADERVLLLELRAELELLARTYGERGALFEKWITCRKLRIKANLLTRLRDVDELEADLEQAVYAEMANPLSEAVPSKELIRKAKRVTARWRREEPVVHTLQA
ncbi:IucA/IucC family protein [Paenibacillus soyae]|uniref:IucA/IucC family siderophore biosynthesis protein n=1 Tax=Paenibacillus soyae TaxID=2969249 RepID=A0A9X2SAX6_9BACL|nr:IucA/IucC family protein [Paenibacillus soyae]MCR2807139.1 IucA/IucC family siderophore biosynthesis protein [Paenibacillus soyae]